MKPLPQQYNYISIPGLGGSSEEHWQTHWANQFREMDLVHQDEWDAPRREDWVDRLVETVEINNHQPIILIAHSLACITVLFAAAEGRLEGVVGALLVAPADSERDNFPAECKGFSPIARPTLPFPTLLVASENDPWCSIEKAQKLARATGAKFINVGKKGHLNAESGIGQWEVGYGLLVDLISLV